jgi:heptose I phosphotransferase
MAECYLRDDLAARELAGVADAGTLLRWARAVAARAAPADVRRERQGRRTLRFERAGRGYYLKLHTGVGWREIFKNLCRARLPVLGATEEYRALGALQRIGVDSLSVAAYARLGRNPARLQSMLVTDELADTVSLEAYCAGWAGEPPPFAVRLRLIRKLAEISRRMHGAGINHRDYYLCHFHLDERTLGERSPRCYLIDLHRAQLRRRTPRRWRVKDLAGLYFSAMDCGFTRRDLLRFVRHYTGGELRRALAREAGFWRQVARRAERLYVRERARTALQPAGFGDGG